MVRRRLDPWRIVAGASFAIAASTALFASGWGRRASEERVEMHRERADPAPAGASEERIAFLVGVEATARAHGLAAFDPETLGDPQAYTRLVETPIVIGPHGAWQGGPLTLAVAVEKVTYQRLGATVTARHTVARLRNVGSRPLAYHLELSSANRGRCDVRGAREHNAMALAPDETAEIVVCTGDEAVRVRTLEVLEITPFGHVILSKLPPPAIGLDAATAAAHRAPGKARGCGLADVREIARLLSTGAVRWVDVADFHSRHDCEAYRFPPTYRYRPDARVELPEVGVVRVASPPPAPD